MFHKARLKLTAWYLLIIMFISIMFSLTIYHLLNNELESEFHRIADRYERIYGLAPNTDVPEPQAIQQAENRIEYSLIYVNLIILGVAGIGGYILAGVTLKPIQVMLDKQNKFIADASHELRTPLTSLKSEIEVYLRGKNHTVKESNEILESNLEEANKLQTLSDNLIQLSQQKDIQNEILLTEVSLFEVLETAKKRLQKAAKQKQITVQIPNKDYTLLGNKDTLTQIFCIFIDNAVKYSPENSTVKISVKKIDHSLSIAIADEGIGIAKKDIPHIFERFYRADESRSKQETPGYGLGLSIAKNIIESHHGTINTKSELGKGSIFTVTLPIVD